VIVDADIPVASGLADALLFEDKSMVEVDRTGRDETDGNVYVCWSRFAGGAYPQVFFSRSTDSGATFSAPMILSSPETTASACDIAVDHDGGVYVMWVQENQVAVRRSVDAGESFGETVIAVGDVNPYSPSDGDRNCGDGESHCPSDFVFHRYPDIYRITADPTGKLEGVFVAYYGIRPGSVEYSQSTYESVPNEPGNVGQSLVYLVRSTDEGSSWSKPAAAAPHRRGHQYFADLDALGGILAVVWEDSRADPHYDVQSPPGNVLDLDDQARSSGREVSNTYMAFSTDGRKFGRAIKVSDTGQQPQRETSGEFDLPFHGDYNWISLAKRPGGSIVAYMVWTDARDVVAGRDATENFPDGFDGKACWIRTTSDDGAVTYVPGCRNAGGLDTNIYGNRVVFRPAR
jgi:hypothetical protein